MAHSNHKCQWALDLEVYSIIIWDDYTGSSTRTKQKVDSNNPNCFEPFWDLGHLTHWAHCLHWFVCCLI